MRTEVFSTSRTWTDSSIFCEISLVYNETFVDIEHSNIDCDFTPSNSTFHFNAGDDFESKTGYSFFVVYEGETKNGDMESRITKAQISKKQKQS